MNNVMGTAVSQREDNLHVDLVTHNKSFCCLHWDVNLKRMWPCEQSWRAGSCCAGNEIDQSRHRAGEKKRKPKGVIMRTLPQLDVEDDLVIREFIQVWVAVRLDEALCLDLPVVCQSTCSGCPCFSGYDSCQTTLFGQAAVTHRIVTGWVLICRSFLMPEVQNVIDLSFKVIFLVWHIDVTYKPTAQFLLAFFFIMHATDNFMVKPTLEEMVIYSSIIQGMPFFF